MFYDEREAATQLKNTHNLFWRVTLNVNIIFVFFKKTLEGTVKEYNYIIHEHFQIALHVSF